MSAAIYNPGYCHTQNQPSHLLNLFLHRARVLTAPTTLQITKTRREEGFPQTSAVVKARMTALGAKAFPDDPATRAKSDADADDFLSDLKMWTEVSEEANARDEHEPTFIGAGARGAPIRGASHISVEDTRSPPTASNDDETDESAGRMPSPEEMAKAEAMLGGMGNLTRPADAKEEDLSVPGASVDVQRTLQAMRGASEKEKKWVAMREKEKGNELFKAKEFRSAIEAYTLSLKLDPDSPAVHSNRAAALMKQGRWYDAIADCDLALDLDPKFFKALMRRGAARLETGVAGDERAALDDLTAAELIEPTNTEVRRLCAKARRMVTDNVERKGMKRVAIVEEDGESDEDDDGAAEKPETKKPVDSAAAAAAKSRGNDLFKAKKFADAIVAYTEALEADPSMSAALCNRSGARYQLGQYKSAEKDATAAAALDPRYTKAYHRRAAARWKLGALDDALADYDVAIGLKPGDDELLAERGALDDERRRGSLKPARTGPMVIEEIEEETPPPPPVEPVEPPVAPTATRPTPVKPEARRRIAIEEDSDDSGDEAEAPEKEKKASEKKAGHKPVTDADKRDADELKRQADDAFKRGDMEGAESFYTSCIESAAAIADEKMSLALRANRAASRLKLEKYPEAEADANWVLNKDPRHVKATHRRAAARAKMGQYAGALEDYAVVKRAFPRHKGVAEEIETVEGLAFEASEKARDARRSRPESPAFGKTKVKSPKPDAAPPAVSGEDAAEALKKEGNAAFVRAKYFEAEEIYTKAVEVATEDRTKAILLANRAATYLKLGRHADAEVDATLAIECDGTYVKGYHRRAQARTNSGKFESALEDFEHVVRANPESKTLQAEVNACMQKAAEVMLGGMDLGSLNLGGDTGGAQRKPVAIQEDSDDSDDDDEAVDGVGDAPPPSNPRVDDEPTAASVDGTQDGTGDAVPNKPLRKSVPIVEEDSSDDEDEEVTSHEQVSLTPAMDPAEAAETAKDRGNASFKLGDFKAAEAAYTEAISLVPTSAPYHANRAAARLKLGDHVNALADATTALAIDPNHTKARHRRAMALAKLGRHEEASSEYDSVEKAYPGHAGVKSEARAAREAAESARAEKEKTDVAERAKAAAVAEEDGVAAPASPSASPASSSELKRTTPEKSKAAVEAKAAAAAAILRQKQSAKKPRTATELERGCKSMRGRPEALAAYLAAVTDEEVVKILKASVSADVLGAYAEVWEKHLVPNGEFQAVAGTATALASLPRFAFAAMMMKPGDKKSAKAAFDALDAAGFESDARKSWNM